MWYKNNAGTSPFEPARWLGVSHRTGRLMCYHVLTQRGTVVSRSTVHRVTNIEQTTTVVKRTFEEIDTVMKLAMTHPMGPSQLADFIAIDVCVSLLNVM